MELHEKTTQNLDKARKKATELHTIGQTQEVELIEVRGQLSRAELQLSQLVAEKESFKEQMERTLAAKDDALDGMRQETNEIMVQLQEKFIDISAELASATDCVNSKEMVIGRLRTEVEKLKGDLKASQAQVQFEVVLFLATPQVECLPKVK